MAFRASTGVTAIGNLIANLGRQSRDERIRQEDVARETSQWEAGRQLQQDALDEQIRATGATEAYRQGEAERQDVQDFLTQYRGRDISAGALPDIPGIKPWLQFSPPIAPATEGIYSVPESEAHRIEQLRQGWRSGEAALDREARQREYEEMTPYQIRNLQLQQDAATRAIGKDVETGAQSRATVAQNAAKNAWGAYSKFYAENRMQTDPFGNKTIVNISNLPIEIQQQLQVLFDNANELQAQANEVTRSYLTPTVNNPF